MPTDHRPTDWRDTLAAGDIVAFTYPSAENDPALEKRRPCLVLHVDRTAAEAVVAYGTAARTRANVGRELHVVTPDHLREASLRRPTRFVGARTVRVALTSARFVEGAAGTAVIGHLPASLRARLDRVRHGEDAPARGARFPLRRRCRRR